MGRLEASSTRPCRRQSKRAMILSQRCLDNEVRKSIFLLFSIRCCLEAHFTLETFEATTKDPLVKLQT